jgi:hypothetical protein
VALRLVVLCQRTQSRYLKLADEQLKITPICYLSLCALLWLSKGLLILTGQNGALIEALRKTRDLIDRLTPAVVFCWAADQLVPTRTYFNDPWLRWVS